LGETWDQSQRTGCFGKSDYDSNGNQTRYYTGCSDEITWERQYNPFNKLIKEWSVQFGNDTIKYDWSLIDLEMMPEPIFE
jgi:hypothetical protein